MEDHQMTMLSSERKAGEFHDGCASPELERLLRSIRVTLLATRDDCVVTTSYHNRYFSNMKRRQTKSRSTALLSTSRNGPGYAALPSHIILTGRSTPRKLGLSADNGLRSIAVSSRLPSGLYEHTSPARG